MGEQRQLTAYSLYLGLSRAESSNSDIDTNLNHFCLSLLNPRAFSISSVVQKSYVLLSHFENSSQSHPIPNPPFSFYSFSFFLQHLKSAKLHYKNKHYNPEKEKKKVYSDFRPINKMQKKYETIWYILIFNMSQMLVIIKLFKKKKMLVIIKWKL